MVCYKIIESHDVHDYKLCGCDNQTMIDGGLDYERYGGIDMSKVRSLHEYVSRGTFLWGVLDMGTGETVRKPLDDLADTHIQNIALHLRTRYDYREGDTDEQRAYRTARFAGDMSILTNHILPELEKRGLEEVEEEIPF
jgi:hypothetical protein